MTKLIDLCELIVDCEHRTAPTQGDGYPSIRTPNIGRGYFILDGVNRVSEQTYVEWTKRAVPQCGDLILAREAPVGNVAVVPAGQKFCLGQRTVLIRPDKERVDPDYLCYLMLTPKMRGVLLGKSGGATVHHLNMKDIRALDIPALPEIDEQKARARVIKNYDSLISTNQRRIILLEEAARRLHREWFVHLRFPGHEAVKVVDGLPEGWQRKNLFDIAEVDYGFAFKANQFNSEGVGVPAVRIRDILNASTSTYTTEDVDSSYIIERGDFLIGMDGIFHMNHWVGGGAYLVQRVCRVRPLDEKFRAFVGLSLRGPIKDLEKTIQGATVAHLGAKHLKMIELLTPTGLDEELESLNAMLWQGVLLREKNAMLADARDALLPKLLSGELDLSGITLPKPEAA
ncbi:MULTISPECIES: restriction endonuclease subunit S [unclassified Stenotrophomonas]|uniref:restriction endonuclease subunit S n=1 Tax=unclassified Stenotrophomonas TaxID=196198 RepID=UPI000C3374CF|nr:MULTISPECIES: restriction endonuclease subunit S [unclassified Stenotrophomonas]PKH69839.1 restriction endonuclease subunit S [Stenotrophomonas sp. Betaine-02u-23]PKH94445.1 restriction endonuclease subunit S [Stenotrophomonas sp. Bg11-02]